MNIEDFDLDDDMLEWYSYNFIDADLTTFIENLKCLYKYSDDKIATIFKEDKKFNKYWNDIMLK